jgi:hypothetical protein
VGFMVDKVALRPGLLRVIRFLLSILIPLISLYSVIILSQTLYVLEVAASSDVYVDVRWLSVHVL